jgi:hypothetical protein
MPHGVGELRQHRIAFRAGLLQFAPELPHRQPRDDVRHRTEWPQLHQRRVIRAIVQVRQQQRFGEAGDADHAARNVFARAADDAKTERLRSEQRHDQLVQSRRTLSRREACRSTAARWRPS